MSVAPLSVRDALGGRWSWDLLGWAIMLLPGVLVVTLQEASLLPVPPPTLLGVILVSSAVQSLVAGAATAALVTVARRRWPILPLGVALTTWLTIGVARGLSGGFVAELLTGAAPLFAERILSWVLVSVIWMPLFVYAIAQLEHRRRLLSELASLRREFTREDTRARGSATELRNTILVTVKDSIRPVIDEIRRSLVAVSGGGDSDDLEAIGRRLSTVSSDAERLLVVDSEHPTECLALDARPARASIAAALAIELRLPGRTSLISGLAIVPAVIPFVIAPEQVDGVVDSLLALTVLVGVLYLTAILRRRLIRSPRFADGAAAVASYLLAGLAGSATILLREGGRLSLLDLATVLLLPVAAVISASCVTLAVGIGLANQELLTAVTTEQRRVSDARRRSASRDAHVREQLAVLMHGPVQGRLSACVMALNFHLASRHRADPHRTAAVTSAVLNHLGAASRDLEQISLSRSAEPRRS
jgi:hypothetical protein